VVPHSKKVRSNLSLLAATSSSGQAFGCLAPSVSNITQLQAELTDDEVNITSVDTILQRLQEAANILRQHQKRHSELRSTHLEELVEAMVLDRSPDLVHDSVAHIKEERVTSQIRQFIKRENLRRMFRKIKRALKPVAQQGLSKIDVPDATACTTAHGDPSNPKEWKGPGLHLLSLNLLLE